MPSFSRDPFRDESKVEDEWFSSYVPYGRSADRSAVLCTASGFEEDKPTWKPPARQSSRPAPKMEDERDEEGWFV